MYVCMHTREEAVENARASFDTPFDLLYSNDEQFVTNARGLVKGCAGDVAAEDSAPQQETPTGSALREIQSLLELKSGDYIREEHNTTYKHYLIVVDVVDVNRVRVIDKLDTGVVEEIKVY